MPASFAIYVGGSPRFFNISMSSIEILVAFSLGPRLAPFFASIISSSTRSVIMAPAGLLESEYERVALKP